MTILRSQNRAEKQESQQETTCARNQQKPKQGKNQQKKNCRSPNKKSGSWYFCPRLHYWGCLKASCKRCGRSTQRGRRKPSNGTALNRAWAENWGPSSHSMNDHQLLLFIHFCKNRKKKKKKICKWHTQQLSSGPPPLHAEWPRATSQRKSWEPKTSERWVEIRKPNFSGIRCWNNGGKNNHA